MNLRRLAAPAMLSASMQAVILIWSSRHFGASAVGVYAVTTAVVLAFTSVITSAAAQSVLLESEELNSSRYGVVCSALSFCVGALVGVVYCLLWNESGSITISIALLAAAFAGAETGAVMRESDLIRNQKMWQVGSLYVYAGLAQLLMLTLFEVLSVSASHGLFMISLAGSLARWSFAPSSRTNVLSYSFLMRVLFKYIKVMNLSSLSSIFVSQVDRVVVGHVFGPEAAGFYVRSVAIISLPSTIFARFLGKPVLAAGLNANFGASLRTDISRLILITLVVGVIAALLIFPFSERILSFTFGQEWVAGAIFFKIAVFSASPRLIVKFCDTLLRSFGRLRSLQSAFLWYSSFLAVACLPVMYTRQVNGLWFLTVAYMLAAAVFSAYVLGATRGSASER
jgi:O-antigen/teichoic acid export membrane protein